ncbi:MAG: hypothetical protein AAF639_45435 [Chloroflexota bacterium]
MSNTNYIVKKLSPFDSEAEEAAEVCNAANAANLVAGNYRITTVDNWKEQDAEWGGRHSYLYTGRTL